MQQQVENIKASDIKQITDKEYEIYNKMKKERTEKIKKELIKEFGSAPLSFLILLSSICLAIISTLYLKYVYYVDLTKILIKLNLLDLYLIFGMVIGIAFFIIYLFLFSISLLLYKKYLELSFIDNK